MKKSLIAAAGAVLITPFLVLGTPIAHAYTPGECYGHSTDGSCATSACGDLINQGGQAAKDCVQAVDQRPQKIWDCSHWNYALDHANRVQCDLAEDCAETHSDGTDCMGNGGIPEDTPKCGFDHPCN